MELALNVRAGGLPFFFNSFIQDTWVDWDVTKGLAKGDVCDPNLDISNSTYNVEPMIKFLIPWSCQQSNIIFLLIQSHPNHTNPFKCIKNVYFAMINIFVALSPNIVEAHLKGFEWVPFNRNLAREYQTFKDTLKNSVISHLWQPKCIWYLRRFVVSAWMCDER